MKKQLSLFGDLTLRDARDAYHPAVKDLPHEDQPVERLYLNAPSTLSTTEILAILLGTSHALDDANRILSNLDGLNGLVAAPAYQLEEEDGVGHVTAARIAAAVELGRRVALAAAPQERTSICSPSEASMLLISEMSHLEQEHFCVLILNTRNQILHKQTLYIGSLNATHIRVGEVFREAIRRNAAAIIVAHNHPSGDPSPSPEDVAVTKRIVDAGKQLDIDVLDHIVIGECSFISLRERGLGWN